MFDSPLYRFVVNENLPIGTVIDTIALSIRDNNSSNVHYYFDPTSQLFNILSNGSLILINHLDLEELNDNGQIDSNSIINLNVFIFFYCFY